MAAGPNLVWIVTPVTKLEAKDTAINNCFLISRTNARASDIGRAAVVFREAGVDDNPAKLAQVSSFTSLQLPSLNNGSPRSVVLKASIPARVILQARRWQLQQDFQPEQHQQCSDDYGDARFSVEYLRNFQG